MVLSNIWNDLAGGELIGMKKCKQKAYQKNNYYCLTDQSAFVNQSLNLQNTEQII